MTKNRAFAFLLIIFTLCGWTGCSFDAEGNRVIGAPGFGNGSLYDKPPAAILIQDRIAAISTYLSGKELEPIEGVWVWDNNDYEVAIIRNTTEHYKGYDYLGVITDTRNSNWSRGQIKLLLKETASSQAYSGMYLGSEHDELGTMFLLSSQNLIEFNVPLGPYGSQQRVMLVRNFPKEARSSSVIDTENGSGTGFFVSQEFVATNYHVVREAKKISLSVGGALVQGELFLKDSQNDLALLRISSANHSTAVTTLKGVKCLVLGNSDQARSGDPVFTLGFPLSGLLAATPSVGQGVISNSAGMDNDPRMFQVSIPIQPGNSGSPLLDSSGHLIGVVTSTLNSKAMWKATGTLPQNVNFAIKGSYLKSMLSMAPSSDCPISSQAKQSLTAREIQDNYASSVVGIRISR
jgi:S1-C subfamily serine protease